jgi:uncharacterized protein (TIGR02145 family)
MKKQFFAAACALVCTARLLAQEPTVSIKINELERYRFDSIRITITNPSTALFIGDSAGNNTLNPNNIIGIGKFAGANDTAGFDNVFIGHNSGRFNSRGFLNTFVGSYAGNQNDTGSYNTFVGYNSGRDNYGGHLNAFFGRRAGERNVSGSENTFIGTSAGALNIDGTGNTYVGRVAGLSNQHGDSNVFIGNWAGYGVSSSHTLIIANSGTSEPLIYGNFEEKMLKFHANSVETTGLLSADGEVRTFENFRANGKPGINDTINSITTVSFMQNKLKYRSMIITGGIITYMSEESDWLDTIGDYMVPCGEISLIGEFNDWAGDYPMRRNTANDSLWSATLKLTVSDDMSEPIDSIIEAKFRENMDWWVSWGSTSFPSGIGTNQYGLNIPVLLDDAGDTTIYFVTFNCKTGYYFFENLTGFCNDSLTDVRDGKKYATVLIGNQCWMAQDLNVGTMIEANDDQANNSQIEKYCYNNQESNCSLWGGLYQWPELMQYSTTPGIQGICPEGWHVPDDEEFKVLEGNTDTHYGPDDPAWDGTGWRGADAGQRLRATTGWSGSVAGTDNYGFHAVPGGYMVDYNVFNDGGGCNQYHTSTSDSYGTPYIRHINGDFSQITRNTNDAYDGCSVRCVKDK